MSYFTLLLSPLNLLFFIIVAGLALGKIQIKGISLGIAGVLFVSIFVGFLINQLIPDKNSEIIVNIQNTLKIFSKLGTSLSISAIGLQTGFSIKEHSENSFFAFLIGSLMSITGVAIALLIPLFDKTINYSSLLGILCGALTNTAGLSSVCEMIERSSENAVLGYGSSYPSGIILAVFFTQLFSKNHTNSSVQSSQQQDIKSNIYLEMILICLTALLGSILGNIKISFLSFGTTACTLIAGLLVGDIFCKTAKSNAISRQHLNSFRDLGLALFFVGTGFSTSSQNIAFDIKSVLYGMLITLSAIVCGLVLCTLIGKKQPLQREFVIAGGMTSSPAYGSLTNSATNSSANCFSFSYFGALITLIVAIQIICHGMPL